MMWYPNSTIRIASAIVLACAALPDPMRAQQLPPSPEAARALLQANPELARRLQEYMATTGMTPAQIRQRLKAAGYSDAMLDPLMRGAGSDAAMDSLATTLDVIEAMRALGVTPDTGRVAAAPEAPSPVEPAAAPRDSGFTLFGLDMFRSGTTRFEPSLAGAVDSSYRLGPGDQLVLIITGDIEKAHSLTVTREGFIVVPQAGQIPVANLTLAQLDRVLRARLAVPYSGVARGTTQYSVSVARVRSHPVLVIGEVARPGSYDVTGLSTVLTALYAAGGPSASGSVRRIELRRGGRSVDTLDLHDYLVLGDAASDPRLQAGDVVFVPPHGARVRVAGEVLRPATYEMRAGETLADLIAVAGGFTAEAALGRVQIDRILPAAERARTEARAGDRVTLDVALQQGQVPALPVQAGDVVRVFGVAGVAHRRVSVLGNVWEPGVVGFTPGMRLGDALRLAGGVRPDLYVEQVLVTRLRGDSTRAQLRTAFRDTTGALVDDFVLQDADEIRVFSNTEFRPQQFVNILGAVNRAGSYPWREGMRVRDLVLLAGGTTESAWGREAEIARRIDGAVDGAVARTLRVPLDSDAPLEPYDNVLVMAEPVTATLPTVTIVGEVMRPGVYTLRSKDERLADVIARAGGLTAQAYRDAVHFERAGGVGRLGVSLARALRNPRSRDNVVMRAGDSVHVPVINPVVRVEGAVGAPRAVAYAPGQPLDYYVAAAGGAAPRADLGRAFVLQPDGVVESVSRRRFLPDGQPTPRAGAVITVPASETLSRAENVAYITATAQLLAGLATIIAILVR